MAMDQRDEKVKQLEQALLTFTKYFENQQNQSTASTSSLPHPLQYELISENEQKGTKIYHTRSVKVDFPRFEGIDVFNWIFKAEQYFDYYRVEEGEKIQLAIIHFDGQVVPWYQMLHKTGMLTSWQSLVKALVHDYGPSMYESPDYALFNLFQEDSVATYYARFMELANRVEGMSPSAFLSRFISGLKKYI